MWRSGFVPFCPPSRPGRGARRAHRLTDRHQQTSILTPSLVLSSSWLLFKILNLSTDASDTVQPPALPRHLRPWAVTEVPHGRALRILPRHSN